jgi:hypothetical protein
MGARGRCELRLYALDCIRINYDASIEYFRRNDGVFSVHNFVDPDIGPSMAVKIQEPLNPDYRVNTEGLKALIAAPPDMRAIIHLIADGSDYRLPIQFRFLSIYKIIELHFTVKPKAFSNAFIGHSYQLSSVVVNIPHAHLCKILTIAQPMCHIEADNRRRGFHPEAELEEHNAMPILRRIAIQCVRVKCRILPYVSRRLRGRAPLISGDGAQKDEAD